MPEIPFHVVVEFDPEDGGYIATTPALAGVAGQGETKQKAVEDLREALDFTVHDMFESGDPLPEADEQEYVFLPEAVMILVDYYNRHSLNHIDSVATNIPDLVAI